MASGRGGTQRVLTKLKKSIENGNYYEAHQMYRTLHFRYGYTEKNIEVVLHIIWKNILICDYWLVTYHIKTTMNDTHSSLSDWSIALLYFTGPAPALGAGLCLWLWCTAYTVGRPSMSMAWQPRPVHDHVACYSIEALVFKPAALSIHKLALLLIKKIEPQYGRYL